MGFWIFMVISDLVVPVIMLLFGKVFLSTKANSHMINVKFQPVLLSPPEGSFSLLGLPVLYR